MIRMLGGSLDESEKRTKPPCCCWYLVRAMVVEHLATGFILTPLFICMHQLQVSFADPRPFIMFENKRFPHFRQVDLLDVERFLPFFPWGKLLFQ